MIRTIFTRIGTPFFHGCLPVLLAFFLTSSALAQAGIELSLPSVGVAGIPFGITARVPDAQATDLTPYTIRLFDPSGEEVLETVQTGALIGKSPETVEKFTASGSGLYWIQARIGEETIERSLRILPGWMTLLPALLTIVIAVSFRQVLPALAVGGLLGALFMADFNPFVAVLRWGDQLILGSLTSSWNASILLVILTLGGMIGIISQNGSVYGVVNLVTGWAKTPRSGQLATWALGLIIFFEGFVSTLVVGSTMRPITDRLRISREKLSFIVDATSAPVASIALISGWIGFEVGLIGDALRSVNLDYNPYQIFLATIPYRFYPVLMIVFVGMVAVMQRDFGPMLQAERRARTTGKVIADGATPMGGSTNDSQPLGGIQVRHWLFALLPLVVVMGVTLWGMWATGRDAILLSGGASGSVDLSTAFGKADGSRALLWGSFVGTLVAVTLTVGLRHMRLSACLDAFVEGARSVFLAVIILVLAWALVEACKEIHTAEYIVSVATGFLSPHLIPALTFLIACLVSFATGTSWGTMALLTPLVVPLAVGVTGNAGITGDEAYILLLGTIAGVLSGSVWGDHCSPISDTTIMSSLSCGSDHVDHVRTQMPYAMVVALVGIVVGDLLCAYGFSPWIGLILGAGILYAVLRFIGKSPETGVA